MNDDPTLALPSPGELGRRAWKHVRYICAQIGPRPAGSEQEEAGRNYAAALLNTWGYQVEEQAAAFAPLARFFLPFPLIGALLIAAAWLVQSAPLLGILLPFLIYTLPAYTRWAVRRGKPVRPTKNLLARMPDSDGKAARLILNAHIDSARASPFSNPLLLRVKYHTLFVVQRVAIALGIFAGFALLGFPLPVGLVVLLKTAGILSGVWLIVTQIGDQFWHGEVYSPGAHDNASGVGVLLALAERYAHNPPPYLPEIEFLFTGAEETGMHGAEAWAAAYPPEQNKPAVLCLDMVGAGDILFIISGEGTWGKLRTDSNLNRLLHKADPTARLLWYTLRSGDFAVFLRHGFPAAALQSGGSLAAELAYHTRLDNLEIIEEATLERAAVMVAKFMDQYFAEAMERSAPVENPQPPVK